MTNRFTQAAQNALNRALHYARELGHTYIGSEHILLGLITETGSVAAKLLEARGVDLEKSREIIISKISGVGDKSAVTPADMTPRTKRIIENSAYEALKDRIVHVHLKDVALLDAKPNLFENEVAADGRLMRGTVYGKGVIPVKEVFDRICSDGYNGVFAIEYVRPKSETCNLHEHGSYLKPYLDHLMK